MLRTESLRVQVGQFALRDISEEIHAGEYYVLMGRTGSGKSLLARCILGLQRIDSGRIHLDGREISHLEPKDRMIGYVPQDSGLFPHMNVKRNLEFPLRISGLRSHAIQTRLQPVVELLALKDFLHRPPLTLSGGERQKVSLGRALLCRPKLLILDEPVSALDEPSRTEICTELRRIQQELHLSVLHICHNSEEARLLADRLGVIAQGKLLRSMAIEDLPTEQTRLIRLE